MKGLLRVVLLFTVLFSAACTSLQTVDASPKQIQQEILAGTLLKVGEDAELLTRDGLTHEFRITAIDTHQGLVIGGVDKVPIADIVSVKTQKFSANKTETAIFVPILGFATLGLILLGTI